MVYKPGFTGSVERNRTTAGGGGGAFKIAGQRCTSQRPAAPDLRSNKAGRTNNDFGAARLPPHFPHGPGVRGKHR